MSISAWTVHVCGAQVPLCLRVAASFGGGSATGCLEFTNSSGAAGDDDGVDEDDGDEEDDDDDGIQGAVLHPGGCFFFFFFSWALLVFEALQDVTS